MTDSPFDSTLECSNCGETGLSNFTVESSGRKIGKEEAISFLLSEGETHRAISIECDCCGNRSVRSVTSIWI